MASTVATVAMRAGTSVLRVMVATHRLRVQMLLASVVTVVAQVGTARVAAAAIQLKVASAATAAMADYFGARVDSVAMVATVCPAQAKADAAAMVDRAEVSPATAALAVQVAKAA
jgi:hypothetical protein